MQKMYAANHTDKPNLASLRNASRFAAALLLVFGALTALPALAERPDIVWMAGGHIDAVSSVSFSPDGSMIASGGSDRTVRLLRVSDGKLLRTLEGHTWPVTSVVFSLDGRTIASGSADKTIKLWRVSDGAPLRMLEGNTGPVWTVTFSPDGSMIASGIGDGTIKLWLVSDGILLKTYDEETEDLHTVAFSPDWRLFAWGRGDWPRENFAIVVARNPFAAGVPVEPPKPPAPLTPSKGDADGDGKVTISDAMIALRIAVGLQEAAEAQLKAGDIDGNGKIDISDVIRILRSAIGLERL